MNLERMCLIQWSERIKISKFCKDLGLNKSAVSTWLKYGTASISRDKQLLLYNTVLDYLKSIA